MCTLQSTHPHMGLTFETPDDLLKVARQEEQDIRLVFS